MTNLNRTPQEDFWAGQFGDAYVDRCQGESLIAAKTALFAKVIARAARISSVTELGTNRGLNLQALSRLVPGIDLAGVEINRKAWEAVTAWGGADVVNGSLFEYKPKRTADLAFTSGVMIHLAPDLLPKAYDQLYAASHRFIAVIEYYNPTPVTVTYRGVEERLFKRDFAGEMLDRFTDLRLLDYGFIYHRDENFPMDDINWFLLEKKL